MLGTSARLLRLLTLLQSRRSWPGPELAERLNVTARTLRRDVDRLRDLGYPVDASPGTAGGYRLGAGAALPPLLLDDDEALAVTLGLRTTAAGPVTGMAEAALRALTKLEQVMPPALRRRVRDLHAAVVPLGPAGPTVDAEILTLLATASRAHRAVQLAYCDRHGRNTERVVEPHGLVHTGPRWYVVAFDRGRNDLRTFRVDRITDAVEIDSTFTPRTIPGGDLAAYVSQAIGSDPYVYRARVVLHEGHAALARRTPASVGRLTALDERRTLFETGSNSLGLLAVHLGWLGVEMEVLDPLELVGAMQTLGNALLRSVERSKVSRSSAAAEPQ